MSQYEIKLKTATSQAIELATDGDTKKALGIIERALNKYDEITYAKGVARNQFVYNRAVKVFWDILPLA